MESTTDTATVSPPAGAAVPTVAVTVTDSVSPSSTRSLSTVRSMSLSKMVRVTGVTGPAMGDSAVTSRVSGGSASPSSFTRRCRTPVAPVAPAATVTSTPVISEPPESTRIKSAEAPISALSGSELSARARVRTIPPAGAVSPSSRVIVADRAVVPLPSDTLVWIPFMVVSASTDRLTGRSLSRMVRSAGLTVKSETAKPATAPATRTVSSSSRSESSLISKVKVTAGLEEEPAGMVNCKGVVSVSLWSV